jgi:GNAT superfamily N-acetyltransferase
MPALRSFLMSVYGQGAVQTAPGRWDWLGGGHPRGMHVALARASGTIVGSCCHIPMRITVGTREISAAYGLDLIVDPSRRGQGVGKALLALRLDRFRVSLSTGQSPAMAGLYARAGGRDCGPVVRALRVRRPTVAAAPRALARDFVAWGLGVARGGRGGTRQALSVAEAGRRPQVLGTRLRPDEAGPCRDAAGFAWRYGGSVYADHTCWEVTADLRPGLVVTRQEGDSEIIVDVFAVPDDLPAVLRATACTSTASRLIADLHGSRLAAAFRAAGWFVRPRDARFVVLAKDPELLTELARRPWAFFAGESDLDLLRYPAPPGGGRREL